MKTNYFNETLCVHVCVVCVFILRLVVEDQFSEITKNYIHLTNNIKKININFHQLQKEKLFIHDSNVNPKLNASAF